MLKRSGAAVTMMVIITFLPGTPAFADHVPSKRKASAAATERVESRLVDLGMSRQAASEEVSSLTHTELAYFSADASRVQVVSGLTSEEFLVGGGWLGMTTGIILLLLVNSKGI